MMSISCGSPYVRVPVLSKQTVSIFSSASIVAPFLTRLPRSAALPIDATSAVGVARTITHGQNTISIVIARVG
jgi:hypothetical protein